MPTKDVEFRLKAVDQTKSTISGVTTEVNKLTAAISEQVKAAAKGEITTGELKESLNALQKASDNVAKSGALLLSYKAQEERLDALQAKLELARAKENAFRDSLIGAENPTKTQVNQLGRLETATVKANAAVNKGSDTLANMSRELKAAGVDLRNFEQVENGLVNTFRNSAAGLATLQTALDGYQRTLRETKAAAAASIDPTIATPAEAAGIRAKADAARQLGENAKYIEFWTNALNEMDATEKRVSAFHGLAEKQETDVAAFRAQSAAAQKLADDSQYVRFWTDALQEMEVTEKRVTADRSLADKAQQELTAFRMLAEGARQAQGGYTVLDTATRTLNTSSNTLATELRAIVDPAAMLRQTLAGVETEAGALAAKIKTLKGVTADYAGTARQVADAQRAAVGQAGLIDQYRQQEAAVRATQTALAGARTDLDEYIRLVRNAATPNKELAAALSQAQSSVSGLTAEAERQVSALARLEAGLERAGLDVNNLAADEERLRKTTVALAASQTRLGGITSGRGAGGIQGIFGLKPYELQNLGFQVNDVVTQIASGTSVMQTFAQQGGQILQIFPGLFGKLAAWTPALGLLAITLGTLALGVKRLNDTAAALRDFNTALAANADGARYNAAALVESQKQIRDYGISFDDAGKAVKQFVASGLPQDKIVAFGKAARDAARVLGGEFGDSAKDVTQAFTKGYEAIAEYDNKLNFLTASERQRIQALFESGQAESGRATAFAAFADRMDKAASDASGPWSTAWTKLGHAVDTLLDKLSQNSIVQRFAGGIDNLSGKIGRLADQISGAFSPDTPATLQQQIESITQQIADLDSKYINVVGNIADSKNAGGGIPDRPQLDTTVDDLNYQRQSIDYDQQRRGLQIKLRDLQAQKAELARGETISGAALVQSAADSAVALGQGVVASERQQKIDADLNRMADQLLGKNRLATNDQRLKSAYEEAYQKQLAQGASEATARDIAAKFRAQTQQELDKEAAAAAKAAAAAATAEQNRQEAAAKRLLNLQQELIRGRQGFDKRQDALGIADLDSRLQAVDERFDALIAKAREFQNSGGKDIGGQSVDQYIAGANTSRDTTKQLESLKFSEDEANAKIKERNDLVQTYTNLVQAGAMTTEQAQEKIKAAYENTAPAITASIQSATDLVTSLKDQGLITVAVYDQVIAKLQEIGTQVKYVNPDVQKLKETIEDSFTTGTVDIFKGIAQNLADMATGAESVSAGFLGIGTTIVNVAAQFIESIATMILKLYALKLAQELTGISDNGTPGGSGAPSGGGGGGGAGDFLSAAISFVSAMFHGGGQGRSPSMSRTVNPAIFDGAPRFHAGKLGKGEMAAIIDEEESVLTPDQMKDAFRPSQGGPSEVNIRSLLVDDPSRFTDYMASPAGEQTIVAAIDRYVPTLRSKLRVR